MDESLPSSSPKSPTSSPAGRVIVTYARSWQALAAIRSLGRRGVEVIAADEYRVTPGSLSRYAVGHFEYPGPEEDPGGFLDALEEAVVRFRPAKGTPYVLMPMHRETFVVARERQRFEPHIRVPLASTEQLDVARHKRHLIRHAQAEGIPVPTTWMPADAGELAMAARDMTFPVFVKLPDGAAGIGVEKVVDAATLAERFQYLVDTYGLRGDRMPIVQEAIAGEDYNVSALFDRGKPGASLVYRNVLSFPRDHGPGAVRETVAAPKLETLTARLLASMDWHGIAQVDWRWDGQEASEPRLLEVNPRFFGGLTQAIASGVDYPWLLYRLAVDGRAPAPAPVQVGTRTETPVLGLLASVQEIAESEDRLAQLQQAWEQAKEAVHEGQGLAAIRTLLGGLRETLDVDGRVRTARELLDDNMENISVLFDADDPLPILGLVYPLAIFLRHGKLNQELLTGTQGGRGS